MKASLDFIYKQQRELTSFGGIAALLGWDQMTYMPSKGSEQRAEHLSLISRLSHEQLISDDFYKNLKKLDDEKENLAAKDRIVVIKLKQDLEKARKVPSAFVEKIAKTTSLAYSAWQQAKEKNSFALFVPHLEKIVELQKQYIDYVRLPGHPYNTLLDDYEEGMTVDILRKEFGFLRLQLVEILDKITATEIFQKQQPIALPFDVQQQKQLCEILLKHLHLPSNRSRLDVSAHPFTTSVADDDVRITTNYQKEGLLSSFFSTIHEAGHALYELGLPKGEYKDTVISDAPSLGIHESQSRFWENMIARSAPFWEYFTPIFHTIAPELCKDMNAQSWYKAVNQVRPSFIRVEADELTYGLHVILRFELELDILEEKITVAELPHRWNEKMTEFLGITPTTDTEGVLQDMHWSGGDFGYFPTYAIGTVYASQLFKQLSKEKMTLSHEISKGDFTAILTWLHDHIHQHGRLMTADDIIKKACGEGLNSKVFVAYLKEKYLSLYGL